MFTQIREPDDHFKAFYEDDAILIQFIVEEFIQTYQLSFQIQALAQEYFTSPPTTNPSLTSLIQILAQLVGFFPSRDRALCSWTKGSLTKFKEYCEQLSRNSFYKNKQHVNLHMAVHQAWLMALDNLELLSSLNTNIYIKNSDSHLLLDPFKPAFHQLQQRFNQISRYIPHITNAYWDNENVILCLLRRKDLLTEIYGVNFLYKHFKWPLQNDELFEWVIKRYQLRGFDALPPTIQQLLESEELSQV